MKISSKRLAVTALCLSVILPATSWAGDEYSSVNKSLSIDSGASVGDVDSVNGSIRIGANAVVRSVESVNGAINLSEDVTVEESINAVNGAIGADQGTEVGGDVGTVNGSIKLRTAQVAGDVETVNGNIRLLEGTVIAGNVKVRKPQGWSNDRRKPVKVEVGAGSEVQGDLIFEHAVELIIHDSASVGEVIGKDVTIIEG